MHQYIVACGYDDRMCDLRRENVLLQSENTRLSAQVSSMEFQIRDLNEQLVVYKKRSARLNDENLSERMNHSDRIRCLENRETQLGVSYDKLKRENAKLKRLLVEKVSGDVYEQDPSYPPTREVQLMTHSFYLDRQSVSSAVCEPADSIYDRGTPASPGAGSCESAVLLSPTFIMRELLG